MNLCHIFFHIKSKFNIILIIFNGDEIRYNKSIYMSSWIEVLMSTSFWLPIQFTSVSPLYVI